jgi:glyoxylase-like metal-dependent hydrolase (beta-lactamase superfamily II)
MFLGALVNGKTEPGKDVCSQLRLLGRSASDVHNVLLSHLHLDHDSGLAYFQGRTDLNVFVDEEELKAARAPLSSLNGYVKKHWAGIPFQPIHYMPGAPPFELACDFFGDGSVFVVRTSGHTKGHCSAIVNAAEGPILLTFDAVHRRANLREDIPPSGDYFRTLTAMHSVAVFLEQFPHTRVVFGHDAAQLAELALAPKYYA